MLNLFFALSCSSAGDFQYNHSFQFGSHYPQGISCAAYSAKHSLLFIGGASQDDTSSSSDNPTAANLLGLTAWRVLSIPPYYKLVTDYDSDSGKVGVVQIENKAVSGYTYRVQVCNKQAPLLFLLHYDLTPS